MSPKVLAEGVEKVEPRGFLGTDGVEECQGHLVRFPMMAADATVRLREARVCGMSVPMASGSLR